MKTLFSFFFFAALSARPGVAAPNTKTQGYLNGHAWAAFSDDGRIGYVIGFGERAAYYGALTSTRCQCSIEDMMKGVNAFYASDPAYARLPIAFAVQIAVDRANGTPREEISKKADEALRPIKAPPWVFSPSRSWACAALGAPP